MAAAFLDLITAVIPMTDSIQLVKTSTWDDDAVLDVVSVIRNGGGLMQIFVNLPLNFGVVDPFAEITMTKELFFCFFRNAHSHVQNFHHIECCRYHPISE